jgi:hypothetical protein
LTELDRRYRDDGLSIVGLAFEMTGDPARDTAQVRTYARLSGVEFPLLIAGTSDNDEAGRALPLVDRVRAFPTTIFLDGDGTIRATYTGFSGPATGEESTRLRRRFEALIEGLLGLREPGEAPTGATGGA